MPSWPSAYWVAFAITMTGTGLAVGAPSSSASTGTTGGIAWSVAIQEGLAYVGVGGGIEVVVVSVPDTPVLIGGVPATGIAHDLAVDGSLAIMAADNIVKIADISDPVHPQFVGSVDPAGRAFGVAIRGTYGYYVDGDPGFHVVDLSDPTSPIVVRELKTPGGDARRVALAGDHAYVVDQEGLEIIDISIPSKAQHIGFTHVFDASALAVALPYVYIAAGFQGLKVVDVSVPAMPQVIGSLPLKYATEISVSGSLVSMIVYNGVTHNAFNIDVSDPTQPVALGHLPGSVSDVIAGNPYGFVTNTTGLHLVDNSDPANPIILRGPIIATAFQVGVIDKNHVAAAGAGQGMLVMDVTNAALPRIVANLTYQCRALGVAGTQVYMGGYVGNGVGVGDLFDPANPILTGSWSQLESVIDVVPHGDLLLVGQNGGETFRVFDVSVPKQVHPIGGLNLLYPGYCTARDTLVYHTGPEGFRIIDISTPAEPSIVIHDSRFGGHDVVLDSSYIYIASGPEIVVLNVSDPGKPVYLSTLATYPNNELNELALQRPYLYAAGGRVDVIDVSDRESPRLVNHVDLHGRALGIAVTPHYAYVGGGDAFRVLDLSDPKLPVLVGEIVAEVALSRFTASPRVDGILIQWNTSFENHHLGFRLWRQKEDEAYLLLTSEMIQPPGPYEFLDRAVTPDVAYDYLLEAIDRNGESARFGPISGRMAISVSAPPALLARTWPNPLPADDLPVAFQLSLPKSGLTALDVFDVTGRLVRRLIAKNMESGEQMVNWDGRDGGGSRVPSGVYYFRLKNSGFSTRGSLVLLR